MTIIVNQWYGLGDIMFTQTLAKIVAAGRPIVWPCLPQFLDGLTRAYRDVRFMDQRTLHIDYERRDQYECDVQGLGRCTVLPFRWAVENMGKPYSECMSAKYEMYSLDWQIWKEQAMWVSSANKESGLFDNFGMSILDDYTILNNTFGSDGKLHAEIKVNGILMSNIEGYSLFDWSYMLQYASEIHTVSTSIIYLLELLELKAPEVHLYPRKPIETDFRNIDYLLQKHKYVLHS